MTTNPICPTHNKEMRQNSRGWYCATKDETSPTGWCQYKPGDDVAASTPSSSKPHTTRPAAPTSAHRSFHTEKGTELPLLDLQGKPYLQVAHRLVWFREEHPDWTIETDGKQTEDDRAIFRAFIKDETGRLIASATKHETKAGFADFIEKAETGAIGRALALCGYGTQYAPELEEGERLADAPIAPAKRAPKVRAKTAGDQEFEDSLPPEEPQPKSPAGKKILAAKKEVAGKKEPTDDELSEAFGGTVA